MSANEPQAWLVIIGMVLVPLMAFCLYFTPYLIAQARGHQNRGTILCFNLLLGWTGLIWLICLAWAFTYVERPYHRRHRIIHHDELQPW